ncbi:dihydroorotate dehydrogenase (quinone) [Comamonas sp. JC664]|uniref:dihydroorotate dehydrogenase (quinone) n=1 Tax=Comamonas sp. JC664 TaxID=2801917 RepID=UPI00174DF1B5|nr:dihydroorotate dehydrogenase (quinone) [Comamonas sp. JC664]MBL0694486.1 hypothetical protein [Comamonas sp. JC664]GHG77823.1 hypothetical protein GCM10012319_28210 [Comamonas sp. KCTC 72670]
MKDFYTGFEGESEILFTLRGENVPDQLIRMWAGYFDDIAMRIELEDGKFTGLALTYHLVEGWQDGVPWKVPDLGHTVKQWEGICTTGLSPESLEVHGAVLDLLRSAIESNGEVWISD